MISYALRCGAGHEFDAWFRSSADFDAQAKRKLLSCPECGTDKVAKALMAPNVTPSDKRAAPIRAPEASPPNPPAQSFSNGLPKAFVDYAKKLRKHVEENADYVGPRFAEEARKIHYEESEPRGIYGEATPDEARALAEEGIEAHALPILPEDRN